MLVKVLETERSVRSHEKDVACVWRVVTHFFFSGRRRHTISDRDWSSDVCSSDLPRLPSVLESPPGYDEAVEGEHDHRADDGHDEASRLTFVIEAHHPADPSAEQRPDDPEDDGHDHTAPVRPRHDQLHDDTVDEA